MKLSKQEKKKLLEKVLRKDDGSEADYAWVTLSWDHYRKLRLDLQHIHDYMLLDILRGDCLDSKADPQTREYFSKYELDWLQSILRNINSAYQGLNYLRDLIEAEIKERKKLKRIK